MLKMITTNGSTGAMPSDLKLRNRMLVLDVFRDGKEYTASDVAEITGISRQTVMKAIQFFVDKGLLFNAGKGLSTEIGGKKPDLYVFSCNALLISVAMWPETLMITLSDMRSRKLGEIQIESPIPSSPDAAFSALKVNVLKLLRDSGYASANVFGVTLSIAGTIDYRSGLLKYSSQMPEWGVNVPLYRYLADIFEPDTVLIIENAGKMTGRSALLDTAYLDKRILVVFSTWGLSACLIEKGHILGGVNSLIGEIGHMVLDPNDEERCGCGSHGCFERLISTDRLQRTVKSNREVYADSVLHQMNADTLTLSDLFEASCQNDTLARKIVENLAGVFALGLRNITLTFDPDLVLFQGNFSYADEFFCKKLKEKLAEFRYFPKDGSFEMKFDRRPLLELDTIGSQAYLKRIFFKDPSLYED